jgi:hypothetical protein
VSDVTFYAWKKKYAHLGVSDLRRLRQLEEENCRLKRLVADRSLDKHMLLEALQKKSKACTTPGSRPIVAADVSGTVRAGLPVSAIWAGLLVSTKPREGSIRLVDTHSRSGPCAPTVWVSADLGAPASRRLAGESETGAAAQAYRVASWPGPDPDRSY